jgi:hypothetical protein
LLNQGLTPLLATPAPLTRQALESFLADPRIDALLLIDPGAHEVLMEKLITFMRANPDPTGQFTLHTVVDLLAAKKRTQQAESLASEKMLRALAERGRKGEVTEQEAKRLIWTNFPVTNSWRADREQHSNLLDLQKIFEAVGGESLKTKAVFDHFLTSTKASYSPRTFTPGAQA